jgi:hypothetical protein
MVFSKVGEGTLFKVYLPATPENRVEEEAPGTPSTPAGEGYVLVMDDEENIREVAGEMLSYFGYRFSLCACGEEVVALYKSELERGVQTTSRCRTWRDSFSAETRTARRPCTGHSCSHTPQPMQRCGST